MPMYKRNYESMQGSCIEYTAVKTAGLVTTAIQNPFFHNYTFSKKDLLRVKIKWWRYLWLFLKPTHVQINEGYIFYYKQTADGCIYLMQAEKV